MSVKHKIKITPIKHRKVMMIRKQLKINYVIIIYVLLLSTSCQNQYRINIDYEKEFAYNIINDKEKISTWGILQENAWINSSDIAKKIALEIYFSEFSTKDIEIYIFEVYDHWFIKFYKNKPVSQGGSFYIVLSKDGQLMCKIITL